MNKKCLINETEQIDSIIKLITTTVHNLLKQQNQIVMAVSGGKSPIALFNKLSTIDIPWEKIIITLVDERLTNTDSLDSNENLVRTHLLQNKAVSAGFNGLILPEQDMQKMLNNANSWVDQIDIAILGMGEDGHTASIFPDCPEFNQAINRNIPPAYIETNPISAKYTRIGLNLSGLIRIPHLILSITSGIHGNIKLKVLDEALNGNNQNYPISYLLKQRSNIHIFSS
jgi:6-phosphogluconolactonase